MRDDRSRVRGAIDRALEPLVGEMELVRTGFWVRSLTDEIWALVKVNPLKGAQYAIVYGACCAWVPKVAGRTRLGAFPRTFKQTTLHLWIDHHTLDADPSVWVSAFEGEKAVRRQSVAAAKQVMDRAPAWWRSVDSPAGVLAEARRQAANDFDIHSPRARVVAAFTLARLGDLDAARAELSAANEDDNDLQSLLEKVPDTR